MAISEIIPAMPPPDGQSSNFVNPHYGGTTFVVVNCVFLFLAMISLAIRIWTRLFITRGFCWDDFMMIVAFILSCVLTGVTLRMLKWGLAVHMWDVPLHHFSPWFLKLNVVAAIVYCAATGFTKVSVLMFYMRIFPSRNFQYAVWVLVFIAVGYNVASVLANVFSCQPIAKSWDVSITTGSCMNRPVFYFANAGLSIFTDFTTVLVPVPWLKRLQMPLRQKIAVGCILTMGCFIGVVGCIRLSTLYTLLKSTDLTWATTDALMWCTIELNLGISGGCVTALRPFVRRYCPRLLGLSSHSSGNGYTSRSRQTSRPLHSFPRSDHRDISNQSNHQYSTTFKSGADNSSEEHMLTGVQDKDVDGIVRTVEFDVKDSRGQSS